jgi:hypothetical protein
MSLRSIVSALAVSSVLSLPAWAEPPPPPPATAQQVTITLSQGELPDPEALVQALERPGGRHEVRVRVRKTDQARELTLELWGNTGEDAQVERTLQDAFPALGSATIEVSRIDAAPPKVMDGERSGDGEKVIIKKQVIRERRETK